MPRRLRDCGSRTGVTVRALDRPEIPARTLRSRRSARTGPALGRSIALLEASNRTFRNLPQPEDPPRFQPNTPTECAHPAFPEVTLLRRPRPVVRRLEAMHREAFQSCQVAAAAAFVDVDARHAGSPVLLEVRLRSTSSHSGPADVPTAASRPEHVDAVPGTHVVLVPLHEGRSSCEWPATAVRPHAPADPALVAITHAVDDQRAEAALLRFVLKLLDRPT